MSHEDKAVETAQRILADFWKTQADRSMDALPKFYQVGNSPAEELLEDFEIVRDIMDKAVKQLKKEPRC